MTLSFPAGFLWGTSTAAAQIETASDHNWRGLRARDGRILERTTDHERRRSEDAGHIARFGTIYRCSVDWARLQRAPRAAFAPGVVAEYRAFFETLAERGVRVLLVLHHFAHPAWFEREGGFLWESNLEVFYDYVERCAEAFGDLVYAYNTFNEPNVFALSGYYTGDFPPHVKSLTKASRVLGNLGQAHLHAYELLKARFADAPVGYALNTCFTEGQGLGGQTQARLFDWWFYSRTIGLFTPTDFVGLSYFAYLLFAPKLLTALDDAAEIERRGIPHDDMWALRPEGLAYNIRRVHRDAKVPVWIMENGTCTSDPARRIAVVTDYLRAVHGCIREGIPVLGYTHWSTWDGFEWHLGPTYRFGLLRVDEATLERVNTPAADWYERICAANAIEV